VACTGLYLTAISRDLLAVFSDIGESGPGTFIVERDSGLLVAAGANDVGAYYNATSYSRVGVASDQRMCWARGPLFVASGRRERVSVFTCSQVRSVLLIRGRYLSRLVLISVTPKFLSQH